MRNALQLFSILWQVLSGGILSEALSSFGMADGQRMTEPELAREVNRLEVELGLMEESKDKLDQVNERLGAELSREQEKLVQLDHLEERAEVEERRMQEKMMLLNTNYNQAVKEVGESVMKLSNMYEAAKEDMECPHFLSSINLKKITEADLIVDQEIEALMATYFSKVRLSVKQAEFVLTLPVIFRVPVTTSRSRRSLSSNEVETRTSSRF